MTRKRRTKAASGGKSAKSRRTQMIPNDAAVPKAGPAPKRRTPAVQAQALVQDFNIGTTPSMSSEYASYCENHRITNLKDAKIESSENQVSGHRSGRIAAKARSDKEGDESTDRHVKDDSISTGSGTTSTTNRPKNAYNTATLKHGLNVSVESDVEMCNIRGMVLLQDRMIVSDPANSKLKVFDSDYTLQFEHKCDNKPYDIDMVNDRTIVVSSWQGSEMTVLAVGLDSMEKLVNINTEYPCSGVCCYDGKIYCVIRGIIDWQMCSEVREYTLAGTLIRKFDYLSDGKVDCNHLVYITVNHQTGTLYVTDWNKGVMALTTSGHVIAVMSPPQLKNPEGIAVDDHGQIYVCGVNSHNVIQMSADGSRVVELLSTSPRFILAQCVKIYGNIMLVAHRESVLIHELS